MNFPQVSVSHEVSPLIKLVGRGDTTVVDAYLSPILRRYVATVDSELDAKKSGARLMFMMSSGGLTAAELFQGKDAILSGPAGGVVGMAETGREAGFKNLIGFDMGGTSTDVSHYDGEYERAFETEVAGVRMRAPMMLIHTVAAGGGSVLHFDGARFRVGPDSRRRQSRPEMLPPRRPARRHRRQCAGRQAHPGFLPEDFRPGAEPAARRRRGEEGLRRTGQRGRRQIAGRDRRRLHQDRGREHGQRDQENLGAARLRRHPLCAELLRRRRRPARLPRRRRARHDRGADPSVLVAAVGLRHGPGRHPRHAPARHRGKSRRQGARRHQARGRPARQGRQGRGRRPGRARRQDQGDRPRPRPLRRHRHAAGGRGRHAGQNEIGLREGAQGAVRLHRPRQATGGRGGVGRSGRRRRQIPRAQAQDHADQAPLARPHARSSSPTANGTRPRSTPARSFRPATRSKAPPSSSSRTRPSCSKTAGAPRSPPRTISCSSASSPCNAPRRSAPRPIRSCSRCSTTCSCRSPSRWACRCRTPPIRSTSRSGSTSPARCSRPTARWSPTRRTCRCISARWTARSRPSSARTRARSGRATPT